MSDQREAIQQAVYEIRHGMGRINRALESLLEATGANRKPIEKMVWNPNHRCYEKKLYDHEGKELAIGR